MVCRCGSGMTAPRSPDVAAATRPTISSRAGIRSAVSLFEQLTAREVQGAILFESKERSWRAADSERRMRQVLPQGVRQRARVLQRTQPKRVSTKSRSRFTCVLVEATEE